MKLPPLPPCRQCGSPLNDYLPDLCSSFHQLLSQQEVPLPVLYSTVLTLCHMGGKVGGGGVVCHMGGKVEGGGLSHGWQGRGGSVCVYQGVVTLIR